MITSPSATGKSVKDYFVRHIDLCIILFSITFIFILLEIKQPFYFLQDDTRGYFFPYAVYNYKSLLNGEIALYNFHQYLGTPVLACGQAATLYPPLYISVFLSFLFFGHAFAAVEIFVFLHLLLAGIGFHRFMKFLKVNNYLAVLGGITWPLTSFIILASNSWVHIAPVASYFPWMLFFSLNLLKTPGIGFIAGSAAMRVMLFFSGHTEYFLHCMIFEVLTIAAFFIIDAVRAYRDKEIRHPLLYIGRKAGFVFIGFVLTLLFSLPLLLPALRQLGLSADKSRPSAFTGFIYNTPHILEWLTGLLNPLQKSGVVKGNWAHTHNLTFIGYIPVIFSIITITDFIRRRVKRKKIRQKDIALLVFLFTGITALIWSTDTGLFAMLLHNLPIINTTSLHFKILLFANFYFLLFSLYGMQQLYNSTGKKPATLSRFHRFLAAAVGIQLIVFAGLYLLIPYQSFGYHLDKVPYDEPLKTTLNNGRFISGGYTIYDKNPLGVLSTHLYSFPPIAYNYATLWDMYTFAGYETMIATENSMIAYKLEQHGTYVEPLRMPVALLRQWGVKWYIMAPDAPLINPGAYEIYRDKDRVVYHDPHAKLLFSFESGDKSISIDYKIKTNTITFSFDKKQDDNLTINFLYNNYFKATINGKPVQVSANEYSQMMIPVRSGNNFIVLRYEDPEFMLGLIIASGTLAISLLLIVLFRVYRTKFGTAK